MAYKVKNESQIGDADDGNNHNDVPGIKSKFVLHEIVQEIQIDEDNKYGNDRGEHFLGSKIGCWKILTSCT